MAKSLSHLLMSRIAQLLGVRKFAAAIHAFLKRAYTEENYRKYRDKYVIDSTFRFNGDDVLFYGDGEIICGANSYIGRHSSIAAVPGTTVVIGQNVAIIHFVKIYTMNRKTDGFRSSKVSPYHKGDVRIGDNCWIGAAVFIKEGITIGENSVVGANAVVARDVPPNCIVGGVPARIIKYRTGMNCQED